MLKSTETTNFQTITRNYGSQRVVRNPNMGKIIWESQHPVGNYTKNIVKKIDPYIN